MVLATTIGHAEVSFVRVPNGGIQPQVVCDKHGTLHLIYFEGEPRGGDAYYVSRGTGEETFSEPIRVNSRTNCVMAVGTIRGAQLALGKNGRVHVAWMGTPEDTESAESEGRREHPMLYTHLNDAGKAFEPERNLVTWAGGLDGGGSLGADSHGNVYLVWHGSSPENSDGEFGRSVFVAQSTDNGLSFKKEKQVAPEGTGACGCCGIRAYVDSNDNFYILYRTADEDGRDMALLNSSDSGKSFAFALVNAWEIQACPMSSSTFGEGRDGVFVGTEREGNVEFRVLDPVTGRQSVIGRAFGLPKAGRYPGVTGNKEGDVLVAWVDGGGWNRGGILKWIVFDSSGEIIEKPESSNQMIEPWSFGAVATQPNGSFLVIY